MCNFVHGNNDSFFFLSGCLSLSLLRRRRFPFPFLLCFLPFWYSDIHNYKLISSYVKSNRNMPLFIEMSSALHTYDTCNGNLLTLSIVC